jgi:hypothetical protein
MFVPRERWTITFGTEGKAVHPLQDIVSLKKYVFRRP